MQERHDNINGRKEEMIYTVTFNPSLDYIVSVDDFKLGLTNRTSSELMLPGGKGINVSTVLMNLGIENTALGFTAGFVGEEIIRRLHEMGVKSEFIQISEGVSRINLKLKSIDGTEINGAGPVISKDKVYQYKTGGKEEMIYTVTFNPSLDYIVSVDDFKLGLTNRTSSELMLPGGKGINVSTVLMNLGIENTALGFTAGFVGEEIIRRLHEMGVKSEFIQISEGVSRINLKLKSIDGTEINGAGPVISKDKVEELMKKLEELGEGDVLFLAGSIPSSMPDDMYEQIMARLDGKGVMIVVDATKDLLVNVLKYHPFLVKPNNHELGEIFGVELKTRKDVIPYGKKLQEKVQEMC